MRKLLIILSFFYCLVSAAQSGTDSLSYKIKNAKGPAKAKVFNQAASDYADSNPDTALYFSREALKIALQHNDSLTAGVALGGIAQAFTLKGQCDSAAPVYFKALGIAEKLGDEKILSSVYNGLGGVFYYLRDLEKCIFYFKKAAEIKLRNGNVVHYVLINSNIAIALQDLGRYREALALLKDCEARLKNADNIPLLANTYITLGTAYTVEPRILDSAEYYFRKSLELLPASGFELYQMGALTNLGEIYIEKSDFSNAEQSLFKALDIAGKLKKDREKVIVYRAISKLYEKKGDPGKALIYKKLQVSLKDSLAKKDQEALIHELESKYEVGKKNLVIQQQELQLEKEKNKSNTILFITILSSLALLGASFYFWIKKRNKEALEQVRTRMFEDIVHEIRTPLSLISGPLEVLKKNNKDEQSKRQLELIGHNSGKLMAMVEELLTAVRLENREYILHPVTGDIVLYTHKLLDNLRPEAERQEIELRFKPSQSSAIVPFDPVTFEKILTNLVQNAVKYNQPGGSAGVLLDVTDAGLCLEVKDNGPGISASDKKQLFKRFYRAGAQKDKPGFGIGLSIVNDLVTLSQGMISVESTPGKGSTFTVFLPLLQRSTHKQPADEPSAELVLPGVLIVEDDEGIFEFVKGIITEHRMQVFRAGDGLSGFKMAMELVPDLIIADVMMPLEDGLSMVKRLKRETLLDHIPVILLSSRTSADSRVEGMAAGADAYLNKPFHPDELLLLVRNLLQTLKINREKFSEKLEEPERPYKERVAGNDTYLQKMVDIIDRNMLETGFSVNELADAMCISRSQLHRKITTLTGLSTTHFIRVTRLEKAKDLLRANAGNITEIAYACGFNTQSYFTKSFTEHFGTAPSNFTR